MHDIHSFVEHNILKNIFAILIFKCINFVICNTHVTVTYMIIYAYNTKTQHLTHVYIGKRTYNCQSLREERKKKNDDNFYFWVNYCFKVETALFIALGK